MSTFVVVFIFSQISHLPSVSQCLSTFKSQDYWLIYLVNSSLDYIWTDLGFLVPKNSNLVKQSVCIMRLFLNSCHRSMSPSVLRYKMKHLSAWRDAKMCFVKHGSTSRPWQRCFSSVFPDFTVTELHRPLLVFAYIIRACRACTRDFQLQLRQNNLSELHLRCSWPLARPDIIWRGHVELQAPGIVPCKMLRRIRQARYAISHSLFSVPFLVMMHFCVHPQCNLGTMTRDPVT